MVGMNCQQLILIVSKAKREGNVVGGKTVRSMIEISGRLLVYTPYINTTKRNRHFFSNKSLGKLLWLAYSYRAIGITIGNLHQLLPERQQKRKASIKAWI